MLRKIRELVLGIPSNKKLLTLDKKENTTFAEIAKTLIENIDIELMAQKVADIMIKNIGSSGSVLFLLDEKVKCAYPFTVSSTPLVGIALKALPLSFRSYRFSYETPVNNIGRSVKERKMFISNKLSDFLSPNPSVFICKTMQDVVGAETIISVPLINKEKVIGVTLLTFLDESLSEEKINQINLFNNFVAIAISNSLTYEDTLKQKKQLQIINSFTNNIISTLEVKEIAQNAINSIPVSFECVGAIYNEFNPKTRELKVLTSSQNALLGNALKLLDRDLHDYSINIDDPEMQDTINIRCVKEQSIIMTGDIEKFSRKILPKIVNDTIQKTLSLKTILSVPVKDNNKIIGVINFGFSNKYPEDFTTLELDTMNIVANQIGIALENANLYEQAQSALRDLDERYRQERDLMGIMGHELRTPLTFARGFVERLETKVQKNGSEPISHFKEYIDNAYSGLRREAKLIETLLSSNHVDNNNLNLNLMDVDIMGTLKTSYEEFIDEAVRKELILEFHEKDITRIYCDPQRTEEVLTNLISNAIKYTQKGRIDIDSNYDKDFVYINFTDTGEGISEKDLENIGKKFFRANNYSNPSAGIIRPGGTGLGLYVIKAILRACGGELLIKSQVKVGSTFTAKFPLYKEAITKNTSPLRGDEKDTDMFKQMGLQPHVR